MKLNRRRATLIILICTALFLIAVSVLGEVFKEQALITDFSRKNLPPSFEYPFGTDQMGRDMLIRTICGLSLSIRIGLITASLSAIIGLVLGSIAAIGGKKADGAVGFFVDLVMGIPHILLLILIAFAFGRGFIGVCVGIIFTHWMSLSRLMRGEILQLRQSGYVRVAEKLGKNKGYIVKNHMLPHIFPQFMVGLILLFPHAILHEASITFLGFGLSPEQPAIGIILSESMRYLATGEWWLAVFPGIMLVLTVVLFDVAGNCVRKLIDPSSVHE